jgi:hypothetical protein
MPNNKKQHYVPVFYLKKFSGDGKSINIWNIPKRKRIISAKLRSQCCKDYFYGKELLIEHTLGNVEAKLANIFRLIDYYKCPPINGTEDRLLLLLYVLIQYSRTKYSADSINELNDKVFKQIFREKADADGIDLTGVQIGIKNAPQFSLGTSVQCLPLLLDLECKILNNNTKVEFVTSDNPVVLYNQLFSFDKHGSNTGYASKGLQIFLPISPKLAIFFYDKKVYRVGKNRETFVIISNPKDIYELNTLQICSAYVNLYFSDINLDLESLHKKGEKFRRKKKANMDVFKPVDEDINRRRELLVASKEDVRTNLKLSFARQTKNNKIWLKKFRKLKSKPSVVVRDQKLCDDHREFLKKVDKEKYNPSEFFKFISDKYSMS